MILTVSPVPLAATATGKDVRLATNYSKAVLRAVAGYLADTHANIEYFPSYDIIVSPQMRGIAYTADNRHIAPEIVKLVMSKFKSGHGISEKIALIKCGEMASDDEEEVCDDEILMGFAKISGI